MPVIGDGLSAGEQCFNFGEVVDEVVGQAPDDLARRVDAIAIIRHPGAAVPAEPCLRQRECAFDCFDDGCAGVTTVWRPSVMGVRNYPTASTRRAASRSLGSDQPSLGRPLVGHGRCRPLLDDVIDHSVGKRLLRRHVVVALDVPSDLL